MAKQRASKIDVGGEDIESSAHMTPTFAEMAMEKAAAAHDVEGVRSLLS